MKTENKFQYSYVAPSEKERKEIERIQSNYSIPQKGTDTKLQQLRNLDKKVHRPAKLTVSILLTLGILVFGLGLTFILEWNALLLGSLIAIVGAIICAVAFPIYHSILKKGKKKYSDMILKLTNELLALKSK